jgi:hypothetical protein
MMDIFIEMISYPFMVRAIIVGCLVSLCASLLGTSLVLKRYSMIGDGLSHVGFAALAIAYAFHTEPLTISCVPQPPKRRSGRQRSHISFLIQKPSFIFRMPAAIKRRTMSVTTMDAPVGIEPM